ncbi:MAG TPA: molybdopterin-dependent oxidoreductase [Longimicrobiales bacterium]
MRTSPASGEFGLPAYSTTTREPVPVPMTRVTHPDGRMSQYPPPENWEDWVEWDGKEWPRKVARNYTLVPTVCFNCESACGLLAYVDRDTLAVRKFEGNPVHPGSRGRNCAKGPATINQVYDPDRILYPLKRVGARGEGKWERISWDQALDEIAARMRESRERRRDGIMYHVGRPGEDGYANRVVQAWGVDGHNSHTNICSAAARCAYALWSGVDRPSPDHANARVILLLSSHLETGHYFNPHAQRIMEGMEKGAKLITLDPRLSNTASKSHIWLPTWPGSEATVFLAWANHLIQNDLYDRAFVERWVNWKETVLHFASGAQPEVSFEVGEGMPPSPGAAGGPDGDSADAAPRATPEPTFDDFDRLLKRLYRDYTLERAAEEAQVPLDRLREAAHYIAECEGRLAAHNWRSASAGNRGGWQITRSLFFLNVLTGSVGVPGGTSLNGWNKFVPKTFDQPPPQPAWSELLFPDEYPFSHYEMSFLLPHFLEEGRGSVDVYFTRVYNPLWVNPDGFQWLRMLTDEEKVACHVALTATWNESAWYADYVLPMGHAGERHDLMSQETHAGQWIAFRQPVQRVAMERMGKKVRFTWEANPGEVWEENEFWIELSARMDPDGGLGIRKHFESPYRPGEIITVEEYYRWIFENSVPGLPEVAAKEGLSPLAYMRKYGAFEVVKEVYAPYEEQVKDGGVHVEGDEEGVRRAGFPTPSGKLELFSPTLRDWGWSELEYVVPWALKSHVHPDEIDREAGEMLILPNFRLPTLVHTRSANAKWLYEISHKNPIWMHPEDAVRIGVATGDAVRVETEIGHMVDSVWVTEGMKPGVLGISHHLGRWRLKDDQGVNPSASNLVEIEEEGDALRMRVLKGGGPYASFDPDTSRVWWSNVGVHQNLTHAVHPDPVSGEHCWHQKAVSVKAASPGDRVGDVMVDLNRSMEVYREWLGGVRGAAGHSPDGMRRPKWLKRPLRPGDAWWGVVPQTRDIGLP